MKICKSCGKPFIAKTLVNGNWKYMTSRSYCFDCVPFGERYRKPKDEIKRLKREHQHKKMIEKSIEEGFVYKGDKNGRSMWKCPCCDYIGGTIGVKVHYAQIHKGKDDAGLEETD